MTIIHQKQLSIQYQSAIAYVKRFNFRIFPVVPRGKNPLTKHGLKDATRDIEQIHKWWSKIPNAGIGIPTGKINGFVVLDCDVKRNREGFIIANGFETLEELTDKYGELPDTVIQHSGSGEGQHYLFKYQEGIRNATDFLPGLDIRGDGGYIVAAPSIHPSGKEYTWDAGFHIAETEITDIPGWLLNLIRRPKEEQHTTRPSSYWIDVFNNTREGNRNNNATSLAGHLLRRYVDPLLVKEIMHLWNGEKVQPPLDVEELNRVINSVATRELRRRKGG